MSNVKLKLTPFLVTIPTKNIPKIARGHLLTMNHSKKTFALAQLAVRHFSRTAARNADEVPSPNFQRLKEIQKKFGTEDGTPVYLKGGLFDKLLYQATWIVTLSGLGMSLHTFYILSTK